MKWTGAASIAITAFALLSGASDSAEGCPRDGPSAWCCALQEPAPAPSDLNYRWYEDSKLCEGLISPRQSAIELDFAGFTANPIPSDQQLQKIAGPVVISLPPLPDWFDGPIRLKGMSLKGGRYFLAGDFTDRQPKAWNISRFRDNVSMLSFDFLAYRPADPAAARSMAYMPVRLDLPGTASAHGSAGRIRLLSSRPLGDVRASYFALDAALRPDPAMLEVGLDAKVASLDVIEIKILDGMPAAVRLLVRACAISATPCDLAKATPVGFDVVLSQ